MSFARIIPRNLGRFTLLLAAAALTAARAATLETRTCSLIITNGVVVGLSNRLCGETLVLSGDQGAGLCAVRRLSQGELRVDQAKRVSLSDSPAGVLYSALWEQPGTGAADQMHTRFASEPATGDILVHKVRN